MMSIIIHAGDVFLDYSPNHAPVSASGSAVASETPSTTKHERDTSEARTIIDALLSRTSRWPLVAPGPTASELDLIFDAALRAPDHGRLLPWRLVVIRGEAREAFGQVLVDVAALRSPDQSATAHESRRQRALAAPLIIALGAAISTETKVPELEQLMAVGAATMNMLNVIHVLGYGAIWVTGPDAYDANLRDLLDFDATDRLVGFLFVGSPQSHKHPLPRQPRGNHVREWFGPSSI